jgi:hypothetical protein
MQKQDPAKKTPSAENRKYPRYRSLASLSINGYEGRAILKDISTGGFSMQSRTFVSLTPGTEYAMRISSENQHIDPFELVGSVCWVRSDVSRFEAGFVIVKSPPGTTLGEYINYLKQHKKAK